MADIFASVLACRNLSQSSLINRNLYTTLAVGTAVQRGSQVALEDVAFRGASLTEYLVISLTNGQTQTVMYVRNVPLRILSSISNPVTLWVAVFSPGDPRNDTFDHTAVLRPDAPQVQLSLRHTHPAISSSLASPLDITGGSLDTSVASVTAGARAAGRLGDLPQAVYMTSPQAPDRPSRPSQLDLEALAIREKERQAEDVKKKVQEMAGLQRQAQSTESQLQDVFREVEEMRRKVEIAEQELQEVSLKRSALDREKQLAREGSERAREALQSRNLAIVELRNKTDDADRQLSHVLSEQRQHVEQLDVSKRAFGEEAKALGAELERWRAEASDLNAALERCDQRVRELQEHGDMGSGRKSTGGEEHRALQLQLDEAAKELDLVRQRAGAEAGKLREAEEQCQEAKARLAQAEFAAAAARTAHADREAAAENKRRASIQSRAEADALQLEIMAQIARAAQLDGQVAENQGVIRDLDADLKKSMKQVEERRSVHNDLESTITSLQAQVQSHESEGEQMQSKGADLKVKLRTLQDQTEDFQKKVAELESSRRDIELAQTRRVDDLDSTRTAVGSELERISGEAARLRSRKGELQCSVADAEAQADTHKKELDETQARALSAEQELTAKNAECSRREQERGEAARRLAELEVDLEEARGQLAAAEHEVQKLRSKAETEAANRQQQEEKAQARITELNIELERHRVAVEAAESGKQAVASSAEEVRRLVSERSQQVEQLKSSGDLARAEKDRLKTDLEETRPKLVEKLDMIAKIQAKLANQRLELDTANTDASSGQAREAELRQSLDASRASFADQSSIVRNELGEVRSRHSVAADELARLQEQRSRVSTQLNELLAHCQEAQGRLDAMAAESKAAADKTGHRLQAMQSEVAKCSAEEAGLEQKGVEVEQQLAQMEAKYSEERAAAKELEADLKAKREQLINAKADLEQCNANLAAARIKGSPEAAGLSDPQGGSSALEMQSKELRTKVAMAEAAAVRASQLRQEHEDAKRKKQERQEESARRLASHDAELESTRTNLEKACTDMVNEKNMELEQRISRIDELERTVLTLSNSLEGVGGASQQHALERLRVAEALEKEAQTDVADQITRLSVFHQELKVLEDMKEQLQRRVAAAEARVSSAEEASTRSQKEARERAEQLTELKAQAAKAAEEHEAQVKNVLNEVFIQEKQSVEQTNAIVELGKQATVLRSQCEAAKQSLQEHEKLYEVQCSSLATVQLDLQAVEAERRLALGQAEQQMLVLNELEEELARLGTLEEQLAAEEQKVRLLQEQLASRQEQQRSAEAEVKNLDASRDDLISEVADTQGKLRELEDKLAYQAEHSNIQCSTIEQLEEDIRTLENESEILTLGVHGMVQQAEFLEKENSLMKQKMEGIYDGTLQDWAAEVHRIKVASEVEHHKAEVSSWKEIAQKAEHELQTDVAKMQRQNAEAEAGLRKKLEALCEELPRLERKLQEQDDSRPEVSGSVHSVPATLHGLVAPVRPLPVNAARRRALLIGCNYAKSHRPLQGCTNDMLNMQSLLRHSLQYESDKVRCLMEGSDKNPYPANRLPTKANILEGIQWLTGHATPGDNLLFYFTGYGTQQPVKSGTDDGLCEAYFVPDDFAEDLPSDFFAPGSRSSSLPGLSYRLVALAELSNAILRLPPHCKVTVVIDCCHAVVPNMTPVNPAPATFRRVTMEPTDSVPKKANSVLASQPRLLELPPLMMVPTRVLPGVPHCCCHCYSACQSEQWCAEFPIEGCVQGAFTWTFVKALTAGHLHTTVHQHGKALHSILEDLRYHFRWIEQTPVLQMSGSAKLQDCVLLS